MDPMEQMMLRMAELQLKIPSWAKAEQMENCIPQKELWNYPDDPARVTAKKCKRLQAREDFSPR